MFRWFREKFIDRIVFGAARSPRWRDVRNAYLRQNPYCAVTGSTTKCEVHHVVPYHVDPSRELDPTNLITLRRDMHYLFGHLINWRSYNETVREDASAWNRKIATRPIKVAVK